MKRHSYFTILHYFSITLLMLVLMHWIQASVGYSWDGSLLQVSFICGYLTMVQLNPNALEWCVTLIL